MKHPSLAAAIWSMILCLTVFAPLSNSQATLSTPTSSTPVPSTLTQVFLPLVCQESMPTPMLTPVSTPRELELVGVWSYMHEDPLGDEFYRVLGELKNNTGRIVHDVHGTVEFYDTHGLYLGDRPYICGILLPGQRACFEAVWQYDEGAATSYEVRKTYVGFASIARNYSTSGVYGIFVPPYLYRVRGIVQNDDTESYYLTGRATFYDADYRVVGCECAWIGEKNLEPGETSWFEVEFQSILASEVASFSLRFD